MSQSEPLIIPLSSPRPRRGTRDWVVQGAHSDYSRPTGHRRIGPRLCWFCHIAVSALANRASKAEDFSRAALRSHFLEDSDCSTRVRARSSQSRRRGLPRRSWEIPGSGLERWSPWGSSMGRIGGSQGLGQLALARVHYWTRFALCSRGAQLRRLESHGYHNRMRLRSSQPRHTRTA